MHNRNKAGGVVHGGHNPQKVWVAILYKAQMACIHLYVSLNSEAIGHLVY